MKINRRDVINVVFGSNTRENHLVIVLSPEAVNEEEDQFVGIMITDSLYFDPANEFSFPLDDSMFLKPLREKKSRIRLYLINFLPCSCIIGTPVNQMKSEAYRAMIKELNQKIFGVIF